MRILAFLEYGAILIGVIGMVAGEFYGLPKGIHLGLFLIGAGIALGGLESILTRQMSFRFSTGAGGAYAGIPAIVWGLMALLIGGAVIGSVYLLQAGTWHATVNYLSRRPGPVIAAGGLLSVGAGILLVINPRGKRGVWWTLLVRVPTTLVGLALIAAGLAAVGLGIWEWFEPRAFNRFVRETWNQINLREIDRLWQRLPRPWR